LVPWLNQQRPKSVQEGWRKAALQLLAVGAGITTAWLASPVVPDFIPHGFIGNLALGLLASGGSGFWNSILTYVTKAKDLKAAEAESRQIEARVKRATLSKSRG
jgi:preprotein translocase subunit SecD